MFVSDSCELVVEETDDGSDDTLENTVDEATAETVVEASVLNVEYTIADPLLTTTLVLALRDCTDDGLEGGRSQVHLKLETCPASVRSTLNCILLTWQPVPPVFSQKLAKSDEFESGMVKAMRLQMESHFSSVEVGDSTEIMAETVLVGVVWERVVVVQMDRTVRSVE